MNHTKRYITILLFLCIPLIVQSQNQVYPYTYPDSIRIEFTDHKAVVVFKMREFRRDKESLLNFPNIFSGLLESIKKSIPQQEMDSPHKIDAVFSLENNNGFNPKVFNSFKSEAKQEITIVKQEALKTKLTVKDKSITELLPPGWEINIKTSRVSISVYAQSFEALTGLTTENYQPVITTLEADPALASLGRKSIQARIIYQNHAIAFSKLKYQHPGDMLGLHLGAGAGIFRDNIYPELNFSAALYFNNRFSRNSQRIEVRYELKFFTGRTTEGGYQALPNSFLNFSYSRNFAKDRPHWTGIGAGWLLKSNGNLYNGKTMKFFLESDIGSTKLNLVPEFYLTDDYKKFAFGLKLNYKF